MWLHSYYFLAVYGPEIQRRFRPKAVCLGEKNYVGWQRNVRSKFEESLRKLRKILGQWREEHFVLVAICLFGYFVITRRKIGCFGVSLFSTVHTQGLFRIKVTGMKCDES